MAEAAVANPLDTIAPTLQGIVDKGLLSGAVTLVWHKGKELNVTTVGQRDIAAGLPMTRDAIFRIASMTKPITSVAAMMLIEDGKMKLDDPITKWMPEFAGMRVLKDPKGPVEDTYPAPRDITVEDLFTHRAGLAYGFTSVGPIAYAHEKALGDVVTQNQSTDAWLKALGGLPLTYPPGERFHYSHATDVLGFLVGRVAGAGFREFLMERIFGPLGMVDTDFYVPAAKRGRQAQLYRLDAQDKLELQRMADFDTPPAFCGGGGSLFSTLDDYLSFVRMLMNDGELNGRRYLKAETAQLMRVNRLTPEQRQIPFMNIPYWQGQGFGLGLSVIMEPENLGMMGFGSRGAFSWPGAFGTWWQASPADDLILIYLIQSSMPLGPEAGSQIATGGRLAARAALPVFQRAAYAAIGGPAAG
ncbi:MAG TPA: serine hydrolase domain-containing protein [Caulobacteraceae bacterium]|jgi:CubicO group peptidase (beta-lactamase class C family)